MGSRAFLLRDRLPLHTSKEFFFVLFWLKLKKPSVRKALANKMSSLLGAREEERQTPGTEREHWVPPSGLCIALVGLVSDILPLRDNHSPPSQNSRTNQSTTDNTVNVHPRENAVISSLPYTWSDWGFRSCTRIFSSLNHQEIINICPSHRLISFYHFIDLS